MAHKPDLAETEDDTDTGCKEPANKPLNQRQAYFVALCLTGTMSRSEAYRTAYCKPDATPKLCADKAYILANRPNVAAALRAGQSHFDPPYHRLLTKEDLLLAYAGIVMSEKATANERLRAGREYALLGGLMPREWDNIPGAGGEGDTGATTIVVNVFQNAPSRVRAAVPVTPVAELTAHKGNGNGNGNGNH